MELLWNNVPHFWSKRYISLGFNNGEQNGFVLFCGSNCLDILTTNYYSVSMKLDVDISDRGQLLKAKAELARLLSVVEFALSQFGQPRNGDIQRTLFVSSNGHSEVREKDKPILEVIDSLSKKFTTSDVIIALGEKGKESRSAVKAAIRRSIESGFIKLIEAGEGRRPSKYEKVSLANRELANL